MTDTTTEVHTNTIQYILTNYSEIFALTPENRAIVENDLSKMSNMQLEQEMNLLGTYFASEKHIYQKALLQSTNSIETLEKEALSAPIFSL